MKNQTIRERYLALSQLASRTLPSKSALNKVAHLLARFERPYQATETARKQVIADHPVPEGWEKETLPLAVAEARQVAMDDLMHQSAPLAKVPDTLRLRYEDLPKILKRDGGEDNVAGLAQLRTMLGSLYVLSDDEKAPAPEAGEEEPDEAPDSQAVDDMAPARVEGAE